MKTTEEIMEMVEKFGNSNFSQGWAGARSEIDESNEAGEFTWRAEQKSIEAAKHKDEIRAAITALASGEWSGAGLADDLRLVAKLESKRMGAMSSGLIKGVIDRLSALPPPPAEGSQS